MTNPSVFTTPTFRFMPDRTPCRSQSNKKQNFLKFPVPSHYIVRWNEKLKKLNIQFKWKIWNIHLLSKKNREAFATIAYHDGLAYHRQLFLDIVLNQNRGHILSTGRDQNLLQSQEKELCKMEIKQPKSFFVLPWGGQWWRWDHVYRLVQRLQCRESLQGRWQPPYWQDRSSSPWKHDDRPSKSF